LNELGEVDLTAYNAMLRALHSGDSKQFEQIPLGGKLKLMNPQSAYVYDLIGADSHITHAAPAPRFDSAWAASEQAEVYWMALMRDVPFAQYDSHELAQTAAEDLSKFSDYRGPKRAGIVTPDLLFRSASPGALAGPYVSQFLYLDYPYWPNTVAQRGRVPVAGADFMTSYSSWLSIQRGNLPDVTTPFDSTPRYVRNGRDLAEFVHFDFSYQYVLNAALILLSYGNDALAANNPYLSSTTQVGFITFGAVHILDFVARAVRMGLAAAWYHKWLVHRRLRPEEFGGRIHNTLVGTANYPVHEDILASRALELTFDKYNTYLLPQAYPEGCPAHTSHPSGHAAVAGAGATILKAFFREDFVIPKAVIPSEDGLSLQPFTKQPLTVLGELNKLASNIGMGRCFAGIHYRLDIEEGMKLGEQCAVSLLRDYRSTYNEQTQPFVITKFDGTTCII
jgi:membrane-associated phospholipid phosphatase